MSKSQLSYFLRQELDRLNQKIDFKILEGESFKRDAIRHKLILDQYRKLKRREWAKNTFKHAFRFASFF